MYYHVFERTQRKGNVVADGLLVILFLFVSAIGIIVTHSWFSAVNDDIQADSSFSSLSKNITRDYEFLYPSLWDNIILTAFVLLTIGLIISVYLIDTQPVFFFINLVLIIGIFGIVLFLGNSYEDLMTDSTLSTFANQYPYTNFIFSHFVEMSIVILFIGMITMFIKLKRGSE